MAHIIYTINIEMNLTNLQTIRNLSICAKMDQHIRDKLLQKQSVYVPYVVKPYLIYSTKLYATRLLPTMF